MCEKEEYLLHFIKHEEVKGTIEHLLELNFGLEETVILRAMVELSGSAKCSVVETILISLQTAEEVIIISNFNTKQAKESLVKKRSDI